MGSLRLPPIGRLERWDERLLLHEEPLQDIFLCWKYQGLTRSTETQQMRQLVNDLNTAGIKKELQHWVDLTFNTRESSAQRKDRTVVDRGMVQFFVKIQWALFKDDGKLVEQLVMQECRARKLPSAPCLTSDSPDFALVSTPFTASSLKRKTRVDSCKTNKRQKTKADESLATAPPTVTPRPPPQRSQKASSSSAGPRAHNLHSGHQVSSNPSLAGASSESKDKQPNGSVENEVQSQKVSRQAEGTTASGTSGKKNRRTLNKTHANKSAAQVKEEQLPSTDTPTSSISMFDVNERFRDTFQSDYHVALEVPTPGAPPATGPLARVASEDLSNDSDITLAPNPDEKPNLVVPPAVEHSAMEQKIDEPFAKDSVPYVTNTQKSAKNSVHNWLDEATEELAADVQVQETESSEEATPVSFHGPDPRPSLPGYPPIWAKSRQEVCESFDWFRSYQGGVYHARNAVRGYLLSAFSASRDRFEHSGKLIISHGGGKAQSIHTHRGQSVTHEADDQLAQDRSVRALLSNFRSRRPLVLLIDDKYARFPYDLGSKGITYAILGFYTIVHAWAEYQFAENERGRVVRYKFAFQWCESQGEPWWLKLDKLAVAPMDRSPQVGGVLEEPEEYMRGSNWIDQSAIPFRHIEAISSPCRACSKTSPQVYASAWACLNPECSQFWHGTNGISLGEELEYNPEFLRLAHVDSLAIPTEKLEPEPPILSSRGPTTDYAYTRGWHCNKCGRLSCRYKWEHWECMNCKETLRVDMRLRPAKEFLYLTPPVPYQHCYIADDSDIKLIKRGTFRVTPDDNGSVGQYFTYQLPESRGLIHHIKTSLLRSNGEADEIFKDYQIQASTGALPFRRWPMRAHKCRGALLTNYFSQNAGVPYQYVGGTENTLSFDKVPDAVVKARNLIEIRVKQALDKDANFNEVLSAAYMERQRMAFHTDDEIGLGPLVAGLSLGSPALMHFRLLARQTPPGTQRNIAISFVLRHGDVLAMDGIGVQQFYEHTVVPTNFRIAATARYIDAIHPKREKSS